ncbi:MAG: D-alanyl-D-alanine carboxypeptidase family protein [Acidimicrobiales bacterium]
MAPYSPGPAVPGRHPHFPDAGTRRRVVRRRRQVAALLALVVLGGLSFGGLVLANLGDAPSVAIVHLASAPPTTTAASAPAALPWAPAGESAVAVPVVGYAAQSGTEQPAPVASLTKVMTAYVVLHDHPLRPGQPGPAITVTPTDAQQFGNDTVTDQSNVAFHAGEQLSELQMLQGLLVHSANDLAYSLAGWDAGSVAAFVDEMNTTATRLGMAHTHFADASGFAPASVSTAADLLHVAAAAMRDPVFASIVTESSVTLPLAGTVSTYTPMLGTTGVVGVKSGFTTSAGGGDVLAYRTLVGGRAVTALAAVTNQEGPTVLERAGQQALALAQAAVRPLLASRVAARGERVGTAVVAGRRVALVLTRDATLDLGPGATVHWQVDVRRPPRGGAPAGTVVGWAALSVASQHVRVPVVTAAPLPVPSLLARLW